MLPPILIFLCAAGLGLVLGLGIVWWRREETDRRAIGAADARLRRANAALRSQERHLQAQLDETQRELSALCYSISHDLRAPLRSVSGFAQALAEDYGQTMDATALDYLRRVRANAHLMSELIDQLLELARVTRSPFRPETVDLSALARETAAAMAGEKPFRQAEWDIEDGLMVANGDRTLLAAAFEHLLSNAWKFSSPRQVVRVSFRAQKSVLDGEDRTIYQVRDNGVGFDPQYAGKLFGAFQRLHPVEEFPGGHGVGLAIVQRVVHRHGGKIWAEAVPDGGATFFFTLQPSPDRADGAGESAAPEPSRTTAEADPNLSSHPRTTAV